MLERLNKEIRRRTRVVGIFPSSDSYLRLVTSYLLEYSEDWSVTKAYLSPKSLENTIGNVAWNLFYEVPNEFANLTWH